MNDFQTRDTFEIAGIPCSDGVAEFERTTSDDEIGHRNSDSSRGLSALTALISAVDSVTGWIGR